MSKHDDDGPTFSILLTREHPSGRIEQIDFRDYGILRELLEDAEREANKRGWFDTLGRDNLPREPG